MRAYNIAVLSFAHIHAWSYARVLRELPNARLVAVYDDDEGRRKLVSERLGVKDVYDDYRELLRREDVDAVIITSENAKHADQAIAAAEEGKHILCE
ncbi:TPA: Gfo/Idh/MocA family oxidoreductase, partial [Candidatus Bathyarchaeota archaeon]|nr:Gfo/Idh/MocA family oxidoreductase [Candidatus Bathyarchaeota archaeon]